MPYSCYVCQGDIVEPWSGDHTDEPHTCATCGNPVCWDCKVSDDIGETYCDTCEVA